MSSDLAPSWPSLYNPGLEFLHIEHHGPTQPGAAYLAEADDIFRFTLYWTLIFYTPIFFLCGAYAFWNINFPPSYSSSASFIPLTPINPQASSPATITSLSSDVAGAATPGGLTSSGYQPITTASSNQQLVPPSPHGQPSSHPQAPTRARTRNSTFTFTRTRTRTSAPTTLTHIFNPTSKAYTNQRATRSQRRPSLPLPPQINISGLEAVSRAEAEARSPVPATPLSFLNGHSRRPFAQPVKVPKANERRSRLAFALLVLLAFCVLSLAGAVVGAAVVGFTVMGLYKAGGYHMSTWIPFLMALIQVTIGFLSAWSTIIDII
ncbi:hypothetical protein AX16_006151 [Volvariella volvacea WC 439]|nr:hypothetical protein AX16_006151 [Volvariella volvacea WC 439]